MVTYISDTLSVIPSDTRSRNSIVQCQSHCDYYQSNYNSFYLFIHNKIQYIHNTRQYNILNDNISAFTIQYNNPLRISLPSRVS